MKQLIDGKLCDTEKSTKLASWSNKSSIADLMIEEALYKTAEGDYFIFGTGGSLTPYAKSNGERHAGSDIRPLTRDEAAEWAAVHNAKHLLNTEFPSALFSGSPDLSDPI